MPIARSVERKEGASATPRQSHPPRRKRRLASDQAYDRLGGSSSRAEPTARRRMIERSRERVTCSPPNPQLSASWMYECLRDRPRVRVGSQDARSRLRTPSSSIRFLAFRGPRSGIRSRLAAPACRGALATAPLTASFSRGNERGQGAILLEVMARPKSDKDSQVTITSVLRLAAAAVSRPARSLLHTPRAEGFCARGLRGLRAGIGSAVHVRREARPCRCCLPGHTRRGLLRRPPHGCLLPHHRHALKAERWTRRTTLQRSRRARPPLTSAGPSAATPMCAVCSRAAPKSGARRSASTSTQRNGPVAVGAGEFLRGIRRPRCFAAVAERDE